MAILVTSETRVIIQGITGREGVVRARLMKEYGTKLVAGVTPGRGGQDVGGVPVYDSVAQTQDKHGPIDASVIFVPAALVKNAALEAIQAGNQAPRHRARPRADPRCPRDRRPGGRKGRPVRRPQHPRPRQSRTGRPGDDRRPGRAGQGVVPPGT